MLTRSADLPAMRPSAAARLRAACLAQDALYQALVSDPDEVPHERRVEWDISDMVSELEQDDVVSALYVQWIRWLNSTCVIWLE